MVGDNAVHAFIDKIDCCFPYDDEGLSSALIEEAVKLGPEAEATVVYELTLRPKSATVSESRLEQWLEDWKAIT